jgi:uncharacterized protein (DUF305 family)
MFAVALVAGVACARGVGAGDDEKAFLDANAAAMDAMMAGMAIHPTGNVDADFAAMMIPHHEGAIAMAKAELQYGTNERLRRIAQEIIVEQQQEIAAMRLALASAPATMPARTAQPGGTP